MKLKYILFIALLFVMDFPPQVFAATPTPTPTVEKEKAASSSGKLDPIEKIKEMVASKAAEYKLVEKRGLLGSVTDSTNTQIKIEDRAGNKRTIDIDELTKFQDPGSKTFGISDIAKGDLLSCIGQYNKDNKRMLARFITRIKTLPTQIEGVIIEKNKADFELKIAAADSKTYLIEIETSTKTQSFAKDGGLTKSGFSKINTTQRIFVSGYPDSKDATKIIADRIIHFVDVPISAGMKSAQEKLGGTSDK